MLLVLMAKSENSIYLPVLGVNLFESFIALYLLKTHFQKVMLIHKLFNITLVVMFQFQTTFTDNSILVLFVISDTYLVLDMIEHKKTYLNLQYIVLVVALGMNVVKYQNSNDSLLSMMVFGVYLISLVPQYLMKDQQKASLLPQEPQQEEPTARQYRNQSERLVVIENNTPYKRSNTSIEFQNHQIKQSDQLSIDLIAQSQSQNDKEWQQRMNGMPVGIMLICKLDNKITYQNLYLENLITKTLDIPINEQKNFILFTLKFKIIDQSAELKRSHFVQYMSLRQSTRVIHELPRSLSQSQHTHKKKIMNSSITESETHHPDKMYSLYQIMSKLQNGQLESFINDLDHTLEMYSKYKTQSGQFITLNGKLLHSQDQLIMTFIIQDYSRQNKLQKIEEQDEFKTRMINSFSHELRTPLNSASLFFKSALLDYRLHREIKDKFIQPGLACLTRQGYIINDIIDFSQINADVMQLTRSEFVLKDLIREVTQIFQFEYKMKKLGLAFEIDQSTPIKIKTDYQRVLQILVNVLQNALKYSDSGYVFVKIKKDRNILKFQISDEGIGISHEKLVHIMKILKDYHHQLEGWHGFGLIITQMLLRYLGPVSENDLTISSSGEGLGTKIKFSISDYTTEYLENRPTTHQLQRSKSLPQLDPNYGLFITIKAKSQSNQILPSFYTHSRRTIEDQMVQYSGVNTRPTPQLSLAKNFWYKNVNMMLRQNSSQMCQCKTILSVDDEIFNQISLAHILQKLNYEVELAYNGQQAIQMMEKKPNCCQLCKKYLFILMDCQMPVLDGWQTTKILRQKFQDGIFHEIPIIGFTAFTSKNEIDLCKQSGMIEVLNKPLQVKKLKQLIEKLNLQ